MPLLTFSFLFAFFFCLIARRKGYTQPRFWLFPLITGLALSLATFVLLQLSSLVLHDPASSFSRFYPTIVETAALLAYLLLMLRTSIQLRQLPRRPAPPSPLSSQPEKD